MSKKGEFRQFHLGFWTAAIVEELDPIEKLLYIYMITSPKSNMEGVYKTTLRRIAFETGIDRDMIPKISARFEDAGIGGIMISGSGTAWVVIASASQFMPGTDQIKQRFRLQSQEWPQELVNYMYKISYKWPDWDDVEMPKSDGHPTITRPSPEGHPTIGHGSPDPMPTRYDTDTIQYNTDTNTFPTAKAAGVDGQLSHLTDELADSYQDAFTSQTPAHAWKSIPQERKHLNDIAKRTRRLSQVTGKPPDELAAQIIEEYQALRRSGRSDYWRQAPFVPSALTARWDQIIESLKQRQTVEEIVF